MTQGRIRRLVTRRRIRRAVLCLILGGVMTVAIAWGFAMFGPIRWASDAPITEGPYFEKYRPHEWPQLDRLWGWDVIGSSFHVAKGTVSGAHLEIVGNPAWMSEGLYTITERRYGLPWRSMSWFESSVYGDPVLMSDPNSPAQHQPDFRTLASGIEVPSWLPGWDPERRLPLLQMWPGFLYSTLMYGAFAWVLLLVPGVVRKRLRARRGLCIECAYPLGDFAVCPECGKPTGREASNSYDSSRGGGFVAIASMSQVLFAVAIASTI